MKAIEAIVFIGVIGGTILSGVVVYLLGWWRRRTESRRPWVVEEHSNTTGVLLTAVRPGEQRLLVGTVPFRAEDFESQIEEARSRAQSKVTALNSGRRRRVS